MKLCGEKVLIAYSAVVSTLLLSLVLMGAGKSRSTTFDEIRVQRIDIVEPDGTLRMVLSNKERLPPVLIKGVAHPEKGEARPQAGMIFYNNEGTENGGLIFGGSKNDKGEIVDSGGSLSFDRYGAGQVIQLAGVEDKENRFAGLSVNDHGQKVWVGSQEAGVAGISLTDTQGKKRLVIQVGGDGHASLKFLDSSGRVVRQITPEQ